MVRRSSRASWEIKVAAIAFIFVLTTVAFISGLPPVKAGDIQTTAYISVSPNPIGVNQTLLVTVWLIPFLPANASYHNYTVKFTKPDGSIVTIGPFNSAPGGTGTFTYVPDQNGTWYYQFSYGGGDVIAGNTYSASNSPTSTLIVQTKPIPSLTPAYLPNGGDFANFLLPINAWNLDWAPFYGRLGAKWIQCLYDLFPTI